MHRTAKSLELVKVEFYGCSIFFLLSPFAQNFDFVQCYKLIDLRSTLYTSL